MTSSVISSILDFPPLFVETVDTVRARVNADANPGLAPEDSAYLDTTPGGFWYDLTQAPILEMARMWDALNELAASMFLPFSWGAYLDLHGATMSLPRKDAVAATGTVTFTGTPGTLIATGTQVGTAQVSADADPVVFQTLVGVTIGAGGTADVDVQALTTGAASNAPAGSVSVLLSPVSGVSAVSNAQPVTGGADIESDELYRVRLLIAFAGAHGAGTIADYTQWALDEPGIGFVKVEPLWAGDGTVRVIVTDQNNDSVSQQIIDALQQKLDPPAVQTTLSSSVTFPTGSVPLSASAGLLSSGKVVIAGAQVIAYTGISGNTLTGVTGGTGTYPAGTDVKQGGRGAGLAPISAYVTVATPVSVTVSVAATITLASGFTLDGAAGSPGIRSDIVAAVTDYLNGLRPGDAAVQQAVVARIMDVHGVADVSDPLLNGAAGNVTVTSLQVVTAGTVTLT